MATWDDIRVQARRGVHAAFAIPAKYNDTTLPAPVDVNVRWQDKLTNAEGEPFGGNFPRGDYPRTFENIDKIIFSTDELTTLNLTPRRGGTVTLTDSGLVLELDVREPNDGPIKVIWTVVRP